MAATTASVRIASPAERRGVRWREGKSGGPVGDASYGNRPVLDRCATGYDSAVNTTIDVSPNGGTQRAAAIEWRHVAEIGSTNDELLAGEFGAEPKRPVVLRADRQVAGRGRR